MKHIAYCRKSSESEERQILSIDAQKNEIRSKAGRDSVVIEEVFTESMSAKAPGRPVFNKMLKYIEKNGPCIIYAWKLDRLSRNAKDGGEISWLMDQGKVVEIRTYDKTIYNNPNDKFLLSLDFGIAKKMVDDLSVNVKRGNQEKLRQGWWPGLAPFGYLNNKADHTVYPDPERAHYTKRMFELYATGLHGLKEIEEMLYQEGLRSKQGNRVRHSTIQRVLKNSFYCGIMVRDGINYPGKYEPIISKELFNQTQRAFDKRANTHTQKHTFVHRDFVYCHGCGCKYTSTTKKGYNYYYCTNGKQICEEHKNYFREEKMDEIISSLLEKLEIDEELIEIAYLANKERTGQAVDYAQASLENMHQELNSLRLRKEKLLDGYISEKIPEDMYEGKLNDLKNKETDIQVQINNLERRNANNPESTLEHIKKSLLTASKAKKTFIESHEQEKRKLLEILLWNVYLENGKIANFSFKQPFDVIAKTPKKGNFAEMQAWRESNPR